MELWLIIPVIPVTRNGAEQEQVYYLKGSHMLTKEVLHEYGPFYGMGEVVEYASAHRIALI